MFARPAPILRHLILLIVHHSTFSATPPFRSLTFFILSEGSIYETKARDISLWSESITAYFSTGPQCHACLTSSVTPDSTRPSKTTSRSTTTTIQMTRMILDRHGGRNIGRRQTTWAAVVAATSGCRSASAGSEDTKGVLSRSFLG